MRIALIIEGKTEKAFLPVLRNFLGPRLKQNMPRLHPFKYDGRIPKGEKLKKVVETLLSGARETNDAVIALTDVYTGTNDFKDAVDAKTKMRAWVGPDPRFHPHAAQYDFEAWLLPFWDEIQRRSGHNKTPPGADPEKVDHNKPPSRHIEELFNCRNRKYIKSVDAAKILQKKDLMISVQACPELKAFINTILSLSGGTEIE